jgi:hypothetical protein
MQLEIRIGASWNSPRAAVIKIPLHVRARTKEQGIPRLRKNFAKRSSHSAQDDRASIFRVDSPLVCSGPHNRKSPSPTSARTILPSLAASAVEAKRTAGL